MEKIFIDSLGHMVRTAVTEESRVLEIVHEDKRKKIAAGSIHAGLVKNILPSNFAFVDIGDHRNAFLYLDDKKEDNLFMYNEDRTQKKLLLKQGQQVIVQVVKEAGGDKGAAVTTQLSFSGRLAVLLYNTADIGVSKKLEDEDERLRLKQIAREALGGLPGYGVIMRTSCAGKPDTLIKAEIEKLVALSKKTRELGAYTKAPARLYSGDSELLKIIRDLYAEGLTKIIVNETGMYQAIQDYMGRTDSVVLYDGDIPLFHNYALEKQIEKALSPRVWLKSGGFIYIEETETCVVIDVNTGKFTDKNHEMITRKTNEEAAKEVAAQIRLRNLSGMIIIDFIDMSDETHKKDIRRILEESLKKDRVSTAISGISKLGLLQLTRKKTGESLSKILTKGCPCCMGTGRVVNEAYLAAKIEAEICSVFSQTIYEKVVVKANARLIEAFRGADDENLRRIEERCGRVIETQTVETGNLDRYEIEKKRR